MKAAFRQSMAWLHTWVGLVVGQSSASSTCGIHAWLLGESPPNWRGNCGTQYW
jgi:hypothetical protein